jgi:4-hydroxy-tetrahydrodipicolinate synthase
MTSPLATGAAPFGRVLTAMVTPFGADGALDLDTAQKVASHLVDSGSDGLVVSGTTGESPTTSADEDGRLLASVLEAVGDRASVVAGVGTNDTAASVRLARQAAAEGAHGTLIVSPYYNKPPQPGLRQHFVTVAEAGGLPVMLYDIPGRAGVRIAPESFPVLAEHELVVAVKDATGDLPSGAALMEQTGLVWYSGDDGLNLPWLALGAAGVVSVVAHVAASRYAAMIAAVDAGNLAEARRLNAELIPVVGAIMSPLSQGAIMSKAALQLLGVLEHRTVRLPYTEATTEQVDGLAGILRAAGLLKNS